MKKLLLFLIVFCTAQLFPSETIILLIRHGVTEWNIQDRIQGFSDVPLNERGREQAESLAEKMVLFHPEISAIYASDLERAYATAQETAKKFHLKVEKRSSLREFNNGEAEGITLEEKRARYGALENELNEKFPTRKERWNYTVIPGAETMNDLLKRVKNELTIIAKAHPGEKIAVFAHGRVVKVMIADSLDSEDVELLPIFPHCGLAEFIYAEEQREASFQFVQVQDLLSFPKAGEEEEKDGVELKPS